MPAPYTKPHLELADQVGLLALRGLVIPDPQYAERVLRAVGYYRLSGYWYPFVSPARPAWDEAMTSSRARASTRSSACTTSTAA